MILKFQTGIEGTLYYLINCGDWVFTVKLNAHFLVLQGAMGHRGSVLKKLARKLGYPGVIHALTD